jgi:uncharacterized membrane protein YdjX (TVP38/TMEM64 family)
VVAVVALAIWAGIALAPRFTRENLESFVRGAGVWGPVALAGLQIAQILVAPIPGVFVPILAGALYGPVEGAVITSIGSVIGSSLAYGIGAVAGMPLLRRWIGSERFEAARGLAAGKRWVGLIPLFLFPFSPSDALCFAAGTIGLRPGAFYLAILLGRLPKDIALALAGAGIIRLEGWVSSLR